MLVCAINATSSNDEDGRWAFLRMVLQCPMRAEQAELEADGALLMDTDLAVRWHDGLFPDTVIVLSIVEICWPFELVRPCGWVYLDVLFPALRATARQEEAISIIGEVIHAKFFVRLSESFRGKLSNIRHAYTLDVAYKEISGLER